MHSTKPTKAIVQDGKGRQCWICFGGDEEKKSGPWKNPCLCRGSTKWIHESCLDHLVDKKLKEEPRRPVHCSQCRTEYLIVYKVPSVGRLYRIPSTLVNRIERLISRLQLASLIALLYLMAVAIGVIIIFEIIGFQRGLALLETGNLLVLAIALPAIPAGLVLARVVCWRQAIIYLIRHPDTITMRKVITHKIFDLEYSLRILGAAVALPTLAALFGLPLFFSVENSLIRTLLGGIAFLLIKPINNLVQEVLHIRATKRCRRIILDS